MRVIPYQIRFGVLVAWLAVALASAAIGAPTELRPAQKDRLKSQAFKTREKMESARRDLWRARMELAGIFGSYALDEKKARAAQERVSKHQLDLLNLHLDSQIEIRRVMTAEQFERFAQMFIRGKHGGSMGGFHPSDGPGIDWFPDGNALRSLSLTPEQTRKLSTVLGPTPERKKLIDRIEDDSRLMIRKYQKYELDAADARKIIASIHAAQRDMASLNLKTQQNLRAVLTQAQFEKYRDDMARRIKPPFKRGPVKPK